jgi:hypothetical protein
MPFMELPFAHIATERVSGGDSHVVVVVVVVVVCVFSRFVGVRLCVTIVRHRRERNGSVFVVFLESFL